MENEGPVLETLTRRLSETPPEFLAEPRIGKNGAVNVAAVVNDTLMALGQNGLTGNDAGVFQSKDAKQDRNRLQVALIGAWLLYDEWFRLHPEHNAHAFDFFKDEVAALSAVTNAQKFISDPDRREELARVALSGLGLRP